MLPESPYRRAGIAGLVAVGIVLGLVWFQFRGVFVSKTYLTVIAARAGLTMDPGSKVTYNGVTIGRVTNVALIDQKGAYKARLTLDVDPRYTEVMPANVDANIRASTVFGPKYVAFSSPKRPVPQHLSSDDVIDVSSVTTEANTLFETVMSLAEKVDPVKLNATLSALAQALDGQGTRLGKAIGDTHAVLDDLNPKMPQIRYDMWRLAGLADVYVQASPDLWAFLQNAVKTAHTLTAQQNDLDAALRAGIGFGNTGADIVQRGGPYLVRGQADLISTAQLLDDYSPELFCAIRDYADIQPISAAIAGGNGYSVTQAIELGGTDAPYVYPDNLPRMNAHGGPGGQPGCWAPVSRDLWPTPYLVTDTGASIAPYNHFQLGHPLASEYVWGRQIGENTINP
ncbi:MCE family protein [Mycobacterium arosiense]|uniref:MCE-family protein MCE1A n=1 Tax=Mycobacterium arosiense ATCC BAA-1401 = DSM 45069 TaxID=1265311 RepID=A0A1W9ZQT2_MYCAI|nr:MCE family protein [Mycobacterium arosiense]ORA20151.1 MCE-family protein MCE1A [Mycobacterium arosiense ATCC BAA-1401 = DSM 45069]